MKEKDLEKIHELIGQIECPKGFQCAKSGFEDLCRVIYFGARDYLVCLEDEPTECVFSKSGVCTCPIRIYLAKNLKK